MNIEELNPVGQRLRAIARLQPIGKPRQFEQRPRSVAEDPEWSRAVKKAANKAYRERMKRQKGKA